MVYQELTVEIYRYINTLGSPDDKIKNFKNNVKSLINEFLWRGFAIKNATHDYDQHTSHHSGTGPTYTGKVDSDGNVKITKNPGTPGFTSVWCTSNGLTFNLIRAFPNEEAMNEVLEIEKEAGLVETKLVLINNCKKDIKKYTLAPEKRVLVLEKIFGISRYKDGIKPSWKNVNKNKLFWKELLLNPLYFLITLGATAGLIYLFILKMWYAPVLFIILIAVVAIIGVPLAIGFIVNIVKIPSTISNDTLEWDKQVASKIRAREAELNKLLDEHMSSSSML